MDLDLAYNISSITRSKNYIDDLKFRNARNEWKTRT